MKINFVLDDDENEVTPIKVAEALTNEEFLLNNQELRELIAYLSIYVKYNAVKGR